MINIILMRERERLFVIFLVRNKKKWRRGILPRAWKKRAKKQKKTLHSKRVVTPDEISELYLYFKDDVYELLLKFIPVRFYIFF